MAQGRSRKKTTKRSSSAKKPKTAKRKPARAASPAKKKTASKGRTAARPASRKAKTAAKKPAAKRPGAKKKAAPAKKKASPAKTKTSAGKKKASAGKTTAAATAKRSAKPVATPQRARPKPKPQPKPKPRKPVKFDAKTLRSIRETLETQESELEAQLQEIESEASTQTQSDVSGEVGYDEDYADAGSATFEREKDLSIANNVMDLLGKVRKALRKIDDGTYGICESCGQPIEAARLKALPSVLLCINCKKAEERR